MKETELTYFAEHGEDMLKAKGIRKSQLAEYIGIKRQNVNKIFATKNISTLNKIAELLNVSTEYLLTGVKPQLKFQIDGFVEVNGTTYRILNKADLDKVVSVINTFSN